MNAMHTTSKLVHLFETIADMIEYFDEPNSRFRVRAYRNIVEMLPELQEPIDTLVKEKRLTSIAGIGPAIASKIEEFINTGKIQEYELLRRAAPTDFERFLAIPFLGPRKLRAMVHNLKIDTIEDLIKEIKDHRVASLKGFGDKTEKKFLEGIERMKQTNVRRPIGLVYELVQTIVATLVTCDAVKQCSPAGSFRRFEETVGDVDILVSSLTPPTVTTFFKEQAFVDKVLVSGETKTSILTHDGLQVDLRIVHPDQFGSALQYFTGSKFHNVHLRTIAKSRGYKVSEYGFFHGDELVASKTEQECYSSLGMQFVPPELRTDTGEIDAAQKKMLPDLISLDQIKGDLHVHSNWSDGVHTIEQMVAAAQERGYEYVAITDHSPRLKVANGLTPERVKAKKHEIEKLQSKFDIKILFGTEVDILQDGGIDYPDEILKEFDVVVASVHSLFNQDNTDRIVKAMRNPYVHIIGHPSGRLLGQRDSYQVDYEKIFAAAFETNTVLEINGQFKRLDLIDVQIRQALSRGCMFSIDSDAHSTDSLVCLEFGVRWARRGWVTQENVVNTLPLEKLLTHFKSKQQ